jgi:hypothetical protein
VAELNDQWEFIDSGDTVSGMAAAMAEANTLEPTYEEAQSQFNWPEWQKAIETELDTLDIRQVRHKKRK